MAIRMLFNESFSNCFLVQFASKSFPTAEINVVSIPDRAKFFAILYATPPKEL
nr:hypothetical protein [Mycoplasmopsis bovis]